MNEEIIGVIGLGYVGLPLACAFAEKNKVVGFDNRQLRVDDLNNGIDRTQEVDSEDLDQANLSFTCDPQDIAECTFIIVAVPTPINENMEPDLGAMISASEIVGSVMKKGAMVVYESTVYPGVTEEVCLPILEDKSGLSLDAGEFDLGYSPERINPGDKEHGVRTIVKVVSGHTPESLERCSAVYASVITAGVHEAADIKTAEASKVIENVQRDLNIALMNELSKIFDRMDIHTPSVIEASGTKWNFHRYHPGLVGGHCIGVDPYYLTKRAQDLGYNPEVILAGRRINDGMGPYVADQLVFQLNHEGRLPKAAKVWVLGLTFKENVPDYRNTRAVDVIARLKEHGVEVTVWEPVLEDQVIRDQFGETIQSYDEIENIDGVILINGHEVFNRIDLTELKDKMRTPVIFDVKNFFDKNQARELGFNYKSL